MWAAQRRIVVLFVVLALCRALDVLRQPVPAAAVSAFSSSRSPIRAIPTVGFDHAPEGSSVQEPTVHGNDSLEERVETYGLPVPVYALILGIISGLSLPFGASMGILFAPVKDSVCAAMMAFGAGALLFAVTVELYGHALHQIVTGELGLIEMKATIAAAMCGALFYLKANRMLEEKLMGGAEEIENGGEGHQIDDAAAATAETAVDSLPHSMSESPRSPSSPISRQISTNSDEARSLSRSPMGSKQSPFARAFSGESMLSEFPRSPRPDGTRPEDSNGSKPRKPRAKTRTGRTGVGMLGEMQEYRNKVKSEASKRRWQKIRQVVRKVRFTAAFMETPGRYGDKRDRMEVVRDMFLKAMGEVKFDHAASDLALEEENEKQAHRAELAALGLFLGLLIDGIPEGILMGFLAAEGHLTPVLIISLFIANFPESFSSASLLKDAHWSTGAIIGIWSGLCLLVGCLCGASCWLIFFCFPEFGPGGGHLPFHWRILIACVEGVTGGAMIACVSSVMLPEAFERAGRRGNILMSSGFCSVCGFILSVNLKALTG